jgi:hypothetical protein
MVTGKSVPAAPNQCISWGLSAISNWHTGQPVQNVAVQQNRLQSALHRSRHHLVQQLRDCCILRALRIPAPGTCQA